MDIDFAGNAVTVQTECVGIFDTKLLSMGQMAYGTTQRTHISMWAMIPFLVNIRMAGAAHFSH
jgi:hypothetical protein